MYFNQKEIEERNEAYIQEHAEQLAVHPEALAFLTEHGIDAKTAMRCRVGYDPEAVEAPEGPRPRFVFPTGKGVYQHYDPKTETNSGAYAPTGLQGLFNNGALGDDNGPVFLVEDPFDCMSLLQLGAHAAAINGVAYGQDMERSKRVASELIEKHPRSAAGYIIVEYSSDLYGPASERAYTIKAALEGYSRKAFVFNIASYFSPGETCLNDILRADPARLQRLINDAKAALKEAPGLLQAFFENINSEKYRPHETGIGFFDELLGGGPMNETLLLLGAAPGTGKTTLCQQIAEALAVRRREVIYLNFEMSAEQMLAKAISAQLAQGAPAHIYTATDILQGYKWALKDHEIITAAILEYEARRLPWIRYNPANLTGDLEQLQTFLDQEAARAADAGRSAPVVIVDYLHLITSKAGDETPGSIIQKALNMLKGYAVRGNTFVIAIMALSREGMKKGPLSMNAGRDTSGLEYSGDYLLTLNYAAYDRSDADPQDPVKQAELQRQEPREMILRLYKNRFGEAGRSTEISFYAARNYFQSVAGFKAMSSAEFVNAKRRKI